jgi:plastocyanin
VKSQVANRALVSLVAALGLAMVALGPDAAAGAATPVTHTVTIDGATFAPADLTVTIGDAIVWANKDPYPHTATSKTAGIDSQAIASGKSWKYTAKKKGDFPYICAIHPSMRGTLHVR